VGGPEAIDVVRVTEWMTAHVGARAPLRFTLIAGGRSNLTYEVRGADDTRYALRRPPVSHVLPTAHDMVREHTVISALRPQGVPVPQALALCEDPEVTGAPFYVMEFVDGVILRDRDQAVAGFAPEVRPGIGVHLATTLAQLHHVDLEAAGLSGIARHEGYVERQLRRWRAQFDQMVEDESEGTALVREVGDALAGSVPAQQRVAVVHGDYRLDNTVLAPDGSVRAILDWEICTLGDPLADVGILLDYWAEPGDLSPLGPAPSSAPGFATRTEVLAAYAAASDLDLSGIGYYQAFGFWKLACILQGVWTRYRAGATAGDRGSVDEFPTFITSLAQRAAETLEHR
jgi:aminoglycoside phosphotransferase (APT) family kinase protein